MRIGELSRRVGVSEHLLRAWERRYGLLRPTRTPAGYRLYDQADESRVRRVLAVRDHGASISEAVRQVLEEERARAAEVGSSDAGPAGSPADYIAALQRAADLHDEAAGQAVVDELLERLPLGAAVDEVVLPFLRQLGHRCARGATTIASEHFISHLLRRRLGALGLGWGSGAGRVVVLACPSGERHDLPVLCFGVLLGRAGWRVHFLGADTPSSEISQACAATGASHVVLAATREEPLAAAVTELAGTGVRLHLAGAGASRQLAASAGGDLLPPEMREAVRQLGAPGRAIAASE